MIQQSSGEGHREVFHKVGFPKGQTFVLEKNEPVLCLDQSFGKAFDEFFFGKPKI